jgi:hypothetical protein
MFSLCFFVATLAHAQGVTTHPPAPKSFREPEWLQQGVVVAGNWEGLAFRLRAGGQGSGGLPEDISLRFQREHTVQVALDLKNAGVNLVILNFYKTGLATDSGDIEVTKKFAELCRGNGIRVGLYIGGTIFADTLMHNLPAAQNWISTDETGKRLRYADSPYRYLPDFNHSGYIAYLQTVIRKAITELHPDLLHFDNFSLSAPPLTAATPEVNRRFRLFLEEKYTPEQRQERFGFSDVSGILVPTWAGLSSPEKLSPLTDPVVEEWIDFRCSDLAKAYSQLADYARSLDPDIAIELNPHGIYGSNRAYLNGVDHVRLVPHGSVFWTEEENEAEVAPDGILVSKIRSYKLAEYLGETLFTYTGPSVSNAARHSYLIQLAEAMAFNRDCLGDIGEAKDPTSWPPDLLRYVRFFHDRNRYFQHQRPVADVALLRSFPSMSFNSKAPQLQTTLMEQLLIQYKIPFDFVFDADLAHLSRYRVLILADQESLSDTSLGQIADFVHNGGGVVATGDTAVFTEWRRRREPSRMEDLLGFDWAHGPSGQLRSIDKGRAVYIPAVSPGSRYAGAAPDGSLPLDGAGYRSSYWMLPRNATEIVKAIRDAADKPFTVSFEHSPLTTVMQLTLNESGSEMVLHWLNYKVGSTVDPTDASVALPSGTRVAGVEVFSPDSSPKQLRFTQSASRVRFQLPPLSVYEMAVITLHGTGAKH